MEKWISQSQAARGIGCSQQYISLLIKQGLPSNSKKQVHKKDVVARLWEGKKKNNGVDYWHEKARHEKIKADLAELELAEKNGELISLNLIEEYLTKMFATIRQKFLSLPTKTAPMLHAKKTVHRVQKYLEKEIHQILNELTNYEPNKKN